MQAAGAAEIIQTAGGEIQVLHATPEQVAQLQQAHQIQILQGDATQVMVSANTVILFVSSTYPQWWIWRGGERGLRGAQLEYRRLQTHIPPSYGDYCVLELES